MNCSIKIGGLATLMLAGSAGFAQNDAPGDRQVRIQITRTENGRTSTTTREFNANDDEALEDALRDMGVLDELNMLNDGENLVLDLRRTQEDGGMLKDMSLAMSMDPLAICKKDEAFLGVHVEDHDGSATGSAKGAPKSGARIVKVVEGSAAEKAGLQKDDIITAIDKALVSDQQSLIAAVKSHDPDETVKVTYYRDGKKNTVEATLKGRQAEHVFRWRMAAPNTNYSYNYDFDADSDADQATAEWEAYLEDMAEAGKRAYLGVTGGEGEGEGALVEEVGSGTAAEKMGMKPGDVVKKVNDKTIEDFGDLADAIGDLEPGDDVTIEVERDGDRKTLNGKVGKRQQMAWSNLPGVPAPPEAPELPEAPGAPFMYAIPPMGRMSPQDREEMRRQMDQLRSEMDQLRRELRGDVTRRMTVVIATIELSDEEKEVLESKGVNGLDKPMDLDDLRCFPNPSNGMFNLQFSVEDRGDLNVDVHDIHGERVYHETITGFKGRYERLLDLSDQSDGTYFVVITQNGRAIARKLVKQ